MEGIEILITPMVDLFDKIYTQKKLPEQWLMSKVVPIHKKGAKNEILNYRPISNLCGVTKIFENPATVA